MHIGHHGKAINLPTHIYLAPSRRSNGLPIIRRNTNKICNSLLCDIVPKVCIILRRSFMVSVSRRRVGRRHQINVSVWQSTRTDINSTLKTNTKYTQLNTLTKATVVSLNVVDCTKTQSCRVIDDNNDCKWLPLDFKLKFKSNEEE